MDKLLLALSTLCFLGGFLYAVVALRSGKHSPTRTNLFVIVLGFLFQCGFLHLRGQMHARCPVTNGAEILVFLSWATVLLYFLLGRTFRLSLLGVFTSPMVFIFQSVALLLLLSGDPGARTVEKVDPWHELHIAVSLLSFGAFALAGIAGIMYLVQNRQLKRHRFGTLLHQLPPIRYLINAIIRLVSVGLALLTIGIVSALFQESEPDSKHFTMAIVVWIGYASLLGWHYSGRSTPKRVAAGTIGVFLLPLALLAAL